MTYIWQEHNKTEILFMVRHSNIFSGLAMATPMKQLCTHDSIYEKIFFVYLQEEICNLFGFQLYYISH